MIQKPIALLALMTALAACEMAEITQPPVQYRATKKLNEKGVTNYTLRTFQLAEGTRTELSGVPCKMTAPGFNASFVSPAVDSVPDMGPRTPAGSVTCTYNNMTKLEVLKPVNLTVRQIEQSAAAAGAGAGIIGIIVTGISSATQKSRRDPRLDAYGYIDTAVVFKIEK